MIIMKKYSLFRTRCHPAKIGHFRWYIQVTRPLLLKIRNSTPQECIWNTAATYVKVWFFWRSASFIRSSSPTKQGLSSLQWIWRRFLPARDFKSRCRFCQGAYFLPPSVVYYLFMSSMLHLRLKISSETWANFEGSNSVCLGRKLKR